MPFCPECGKTIIRGAKFCINCGISLVNIWNIVTVGHEPLSTELDLIEASPEDTGVAIPSREDPSVEIDPQAVPESQKVPESQTVPESREMPDPQEMNAALEQLLDDAYGFLGNVDLEEEMPEEIIDRASIYATDLRDYHGARSPEVFYKLGTILLRGNRFNSAIAMLDICLSQSSDHTEALRNRAIASSSTGNTERALSDVEKLCDISGNVNDRLLRAHILRELQRYGEATAVVDEVLEGDQNNVEAWEMKAAIFRELGYKDKAAVALDKVIELKLLSGDVDSALEDYNQISEMERGVRLTPRKTIKPDSIPSGESEKDKKLKDLPEHSVYYRQALAFYYQSNYLDAATYIDKAISLKNEYIEAWVLKGKILEAIGDYKGAAKVYSQAGKMDDDPEKRWKLFYAIGNVYVKMGKLKEALQFYDLAIKDNPEASQVWTNKGSVYLNLKSYRNALVCYNRSLKLNPGDDLAKKNRGLCMRMM